MKNIFSITLNYLAVSVIEDTHASSRSRQGSFGALFFVINAVPWRQRTMVN